MLRAVSARPATSGPALEISQLAHKTLKAVEADYEKLAFNKAVARLYELVNALASPLMQVAAGNADEETIVAVKDAVTILINMVAPMMPHLAEECWREIGGSGLVAQSAWPAYEATLVAENEITLPVQINGKKRADLTIARDADQTAVQSAVLALEAVQAALNGQSPKKIIVVPQRIVNVVV
jgi:leucyl-tRNA synthetase